MKEEVFLSKPAFEGLIQDIVHIEECQDSLLEYFDTALERARFGQFMDNYIAQVDALLRNIQVLANATNALPFVLINSEVSLIPLEGSTITKVRIVFPLHNTEETDVSCLSTVGMALLLKELGEDVTLPTPSGSKRHRIASIVLPVK